MDLYLDKYMCVYIYNIYITIGNWGYKLNYFTAVARHVFQLVAGHYFDDSIQFEYEQHFWICWYSYHVVTTRMGSTGNQEVEYFGKGHAAFLASKNGFVDQMCSGTTTPDARCQSKFKLSKAKAKSMAAQAKLPAERECPKT